MYILRPNYREQAFCKRRYARGRIAEEPAIRGFIEGPIRRNTIGQGTPREMVSTLNGEVDIEMSSVCFHG